MKEAIPFLDEEWSLRRSERIFLAEPAVRSPTSSEPSKTCTGNSTPGPKTKDKVKDKQQEKSQDKTLQEVSQKMKKKYSKANDSKSSSPTRTKETKDTKDSKDSKDQKDRKDTKDDKDKNGEQVSNFYILLCNSMLSVEACLRFS